MATVSQRESVICEAEKVVEEAQDLLQEILKDLSEDPETFLNEDLLSLIKEVRNTKDNIIQCSPSDRDKLQEDRPKINSSPRKYRVSHTNLNMSSLDQISSQEISRHIKNIRISILRAKEETKTKLRIKLQTLLDHKKARIQNGTW